MRLWHIWAGKDHQGPKNSPKYFANCSNHISKDSRSMFARQPDKCFNIVNKVVKQDLKWQRSGLNLSQSLWQRTKGWQWLCISYVNQTQKTLQKSFIHSILISFFFWSLLMGLKQTMMDQNWDHSVNFLAVTNEADYFPENAPYITN